jgi:putative DNA primase/helicase
MIELAKSDPRMAIKANQLDANPYLINCPDSTLELKKRVFRPHDKDDLCTKLTGAPLFSTEESEYFYPTLQIALDVPVIAYFQRLMGPTPEHSTQRKEIIIPYGAHYSAKSSLTQGSTRLSVTTQRRWTPTSYGSKRLTQSLTRHTLS